MFTLVNGLSDLIYSFGQDDEPQDDPQSLHGQHEDMFIRRNERTLVC